MEWNGRVCQHKIPGFISGSFPICKLGSCSCFNWGEVCMQEIDYLNVFLSIVIIIYGGYLVIADYPDLYIFGVFFSVAGIFSLIMDLVKNT